MSDLPRYYIAELNVPVQMVVRADTGVEEAEKAAISAKLVVRGPSVVMASTGFPELLKCEEREPVGDQPHVVAEE